MKNGFYHRILQPSEHPKRVGAKKNFFFQTLLDGPLNSSGPNPRVKIVKLPTVYQFYPFFIFVDRNPGKWLNAFKVYEVTMTHNKWIMARL